MPGGPNKHCQSNRRDNDLDCFEIFETVIFRRLLHWDAVPEFAQLQGWSSGALFFFLLPPSTMLKTFHVFGPAVMTLELFTSFLPYRVGLCLSSWQHVHPAWTGRSGKVIALTRRAHVHVRCSRGHFKKIRAQCITAQILGSSLGNNDLARSTEVRPGFVQVRSKKTRFAFFTKHDSLFGWM